jgi:hypothetical protein
MTSVDQEGAFDAEVFSVGLEESLLEGRFRLVIVLDAAPEELIQLEGSLEGIETSRSASIIAFIRVAEAKIPWKG